MNFYTKRDWSRYLFVIRTLCILMLLYFFSIYISHSVFFSASNLGAILYYTCLLVPAVLGVHLLVVLGQFDLSVGSVAAFCGMVSAVSAKAGYSFSICITVALCAGVMCGTANWLLVSKARIPAIVGTLVTMSGARAAALGLSDAQVVGGIPLRFGALTERMFGLISPAVVLGLTLVLTLEVLSRRHIIVRHMHHAGSNRDAVKNAGINLSALEWIGFVSAGIGASAVGVLQCSRTLSASPLIFADLALECIAACIIGGARFTGGSGSAAGAFAGMLVMVASRNLVVLAGISLYWRDLGIALVLLGAVLFNKPRENA